MNIGETLYRKVLVSEEEGLDLVMLLDMEIMFTRHKLSSTDDSVLRRSYMRKLKNYGAVADRIRYANKERVEV